MPSSTVVHIGGWPGVGKMTIGRIVAESLGGRLIHNHLMLDAARAIYARNTPEFVQMREEVRNLVLSHARQLPKEIPIVFTDALAEEPASVPLFQPTLDFAKERDANLHLFVLEVSVRENQRRLKDPARLAGTKLTDIDVLTNLRETEKLFVPDSAVVLDVTNQSAKSAAATICRHLERPVG